MNQRVVIYHTCQSGRTGTDRELRQFVDSRGDTVVATYSNSPPGGRHGRRRSGWKALLAGLGGIDQVVVQSAGDLPGRKVHDLLNFLDRLKDHGVGLYLVTEDIDTGNGAAFTLLEIVEAYRRAKLSQAIRAGQTRALAAGKRVGRPLVSVSLRRHILAALAAGSGIRPTARRFKVSPGSVINIRRTMALVHAEAA